MTHHKNKPHHISIRKALREAAKWLRGMGDKNPKLKKPFDEAADRDVAAAAVIDELEKELEIQMALAQDNVTALLAKEQQLKADNATLTASNATLTTANTDLQTQLATAQANAITPELNAAVEAEVTAPPTV